MLEPSTLPPRQEQYESFKSRTNKNYYVAYDYRHTSGDLFSCVKPTLEQCRAAKDEWLKQYHNKCKKPITNGN